jgi:hypothetical protein
MRCDWLLATFEHRRIDGLPRLKFHAKPPCDQTSKVNSVNEGAADPGLEVQKPTAQTVANADSNPTTAHDVTAPDGIKSVWQLRYRCATPLRR